MEQSSTFDSDLQMFREPLRTLDMATLQFYRWLAENNRLEHEAYPREVSVLRTGGENHAR
ncbi:MAG: hypothetical protein NVSMB2_04230 [Chloroflexota bacterium]